MARSGEIAIKKFFADLTVPTSSRFVSDCPTLLMLSYFFHVLWTS